MFPAFARRSFIAVLLAVGMLATGCTSPDEASPEATTGEGQAATTASVGSESTSASTTIVEGGSTTSRIPPSGSSLPTVDLTTVAPMLLIQFGQAWADANWKAVAAVANGEVVAAATEVHVAGAEPPVTGENVVAIIETCEAAPEGSSWTCQIDYGAEGSATMFAMVLEQTPEGLRIAELSPIETENG